METKRIGREWTRAHALKSALQFFLHFVIFSLLAFILLVWDKFPQISEYMQTQGGNYLYTAFCVLLLFIITYFYFYFEDRATLASGKTIALVFTVLDVYLILSCLIGYNLSVYARPVALVALLIFTLMGRRNAIFLNIICALFGKGMLLFADYRLFRGYDFHFLLCAGKIKIAGNRNRRVHYRAH